MYSKIRTYYRKGGIKQVLRHGKTKVLYLLFHTNNAEWYRKDLLTEFDDINVDDDISVDFNNQEETIEYIKKHGYYYPMEILTGSINGHLFTGIKYQNRIIGYNKTGYSTIYIEDFKKIYDLPAKIAFAYDTFIDPEFRGRKYATILRHNVCNYLKKKGYKSVWLHIPSWNCASKKSWERLGAQKCRQISYYWLGGISWTTRNPIKLIQRVENNYKKEF